MAQWMFENGVFKKYTAKGSCHVLTYVTKIQQEPQVTCKPRTKLCWIKGYITTWLWVDNMAALRLSDMLWDENETLNGIYLLL